MRLRSSRRAVALYVIIIGVFALVFSTFVLFVTQEVKGDQHDQCGLMSLQVVSSCMKNPQTIYVEFSAFNAVRFLVDGEAKEEYVVLSSGSNFTFPISDYGKDVVILPVFTDYSGSYKCRTQEIVFNDEELKRC